MTMPSRCSVTYVIATLVLVQTPASGKPSREEPTGGTITISSKFPGGNVQVEKNEGSTVHLAPDLRGDRPWFYWYFEARAIRPGRIHFVFPEKVIGFKNGAIGFQGPAISTDVGETWRWMGTDNVRENAFFFDFSKKGETVRFAVTIPYVQTDVERFLKKHGKSPHLKTSVLTKSQQGRKVELLQIGVPGPDKKAVLVTARHHAAETIASFVLEGFLEEALSSTADGKKFRDDYVLYVVPFVDKDGVEKGDQGKNRKPHDHNRDYGEKSIYPEVRAIKKLQEKVKFHFALDLHCPTLVMKDHQVMYFVGAKEHPQHNFQNVSVFAERIKNGLPKTAPHGPLVWLRPETKTSPKNSRYFGFQKGVIMAATLEIPFAPPGKAMDPASCRRYGRVMLQAFAATRFLAPNAKE